MYFFIYASYLEVNVSYNHEKLYVDSIFFSIYNSKDDNLVNS